MPSNTVRATVKYTTTDVNQTYYLTVIIGNGQVGSSAFINADMTVFNPDVENALIGTGAAIINKTFLVSTTDIHANPASLTQIVSYYISTAPLDLSNLGNITPAGTSQVETSPAQTYTFITKLQFS
ncbi:hypothetical protein [Sediminibacterium ginsengisoli]|uniref:Uncharacterized protein n=1 Tax=Sediminibacterium ginsengisoli TaxID=413434 RepID=A0A1T4MG71_9BACT|nr:hypothetical protein [Sediminibacterium ginsengisoli]SJZ65913.1 hypothetical protein SAMN04488132_103376 [Sediminibacterium ginsengisoli]